MISAFRSKIGVSFTALVVAAFAALSTATHAGNPADRTVLSPSKKPALKAEGKGALRGAILHSKSVSALKMTGPISARQVSAAIEIPLVIDIYNSWDAKGDPSNDVVVLDVAAIAGLGTGNSATMTGAAWDLTIDTTTSPADGASYLSEATIEFDENVSPGTNWIALSPGVGDNFADVASYASGGIVDFTDNGLPDIVLPDGLLRIEFFESFDDTDDVIDALYNAVSTITIAILDPSVGACCDDASATCLAGTTDQATCEGTAGQTWYGGDDCSIFVCPPPPADYVMDGTPVTTCSGIFADSGDTGGDYGNSESIVQTFTPSTAGLALEFDFTFFEVETNFDSLTIYNGNSTAAPVIGAFDTGNPPGTITSGAGDGTLTFEFASDGSVAQAGWVASISCVTPPTGGACCGATCTDVADEAACGTGLYLGNGTSCALDSCPNPGDDCGTPIAVALPADLPFVDAAQTTCGRGNSYSSTCLGSYDGGEDIIYELTVAVDTCVNIVMTSDASWTGMAVDSACPLSDPTCEASVSSISSDESILALSLTAGTHYLMLDTWPSPACIGSFDLSIEECAAGGACCHEDGTCDDVADAASCAAAGDSYIGDGTFCAPDTCPPANDDCDSPTNITAVPFVDSAVNMPQATDDANVDPSCDAGSCDVGPANNGVWYTYTPSVSCEATIDQDGINAATSVWTGADCNSLTEVACSDPDPFTVNMAAGTQYWILLSNWTCLSEPTSSMDYSFDCVPLPTGACCVQDVGACACSEVSVADCTGTYVGDGTSCSDDPDPCDCNANDTCDAADLLPGAAEVFDATGIGAAIPDDSATGIDHVINVPTGGTIADLNVDLVITHTWVGDLCVSLTHPSGSPTVQLIKRPDLDAECDAEDCCGCSGDNYDILLDDTGTGGPIEDLCGTPTVPTSSPAYTPDEALSAFDGLDSAGDWTLQVNDNGAGDTGTLDAWSLHFNASPPTSADCNGNGIPDDCEDDCDGNGVPDDCDIDPSDPDGDGEVAEDCNANGAPDSCEVPPNGSGPDCQGDGIPDECQLNALRLVPIVTDGGFEDGTPNPSWTEASTNFGTPLCDVGTCGTGTGTGPHAGDWWAWFGGIAAVETASVEQTVTITAGATTLEFYLEIPAASGNGTDFLDVSIDGNIVFSVLESAPGYLTYALVSVDISAYADSGSHTLRFDSTISGVPSGTNFFVDDVVIPEPTGPPANDCNVNGVPDECDAPTCGNNCSEGGEAGNPAEECDGTSDDACPGECYPAGSALECTCAACGDGVVSAGEDCDGGVCCTDSCTFDFGTVCGTSSGPCDPAATCNGSSADCPANVPVTSCTDGDGCCAPGCNAANDDDCDPVCPNGVQEPGEECDGSDASACPGLCRSDCTCTPPAICGDDAINRPSEECDGTDDAACPGICLNNCLCPPKPVAVPAISGWGMLVLMLALAIGLSAYFGLRRTTTEVSQ